MLIEKMIKKVIIAFCVVGLAACTTTPEDNSANTTTGTGTGTGTGTETVETAVITEPAISHEEKMRIESQQNRQARTIYFEFDNSTVQQQYLAVLELHAKFLVESGMNVTLEGHADERGTQAYNLALGERRAKSVAQYLMNYGLSENQISVVSYGEERPADAGHMENSLAKNRRVEVVYQ